jgi:hypothetical protein
MKKAEVRVGEVYAVKVSDKMAPVVIDEEHPAGGWVGTNQQTNRQVRVKSAGRLRCLWDDYLGRGEAALAPEEPDACPPADGRAPRATGGARGAKKAKREAKATKAKKLATRAPVDGDGAMSGLDAAAKVLEEAGEPLSCKAIVERALEKGYWKTGGKTPAATVYAAVLREIQKKGDDARFRKTARGRFELTR